MQCSLEPLRQHCVGFWLVQCYPKSIKTTLHRIFFLNKVVWSLSGNISYSFQLWNVFSRVLRQQWTGFFLMQCCLEPLRQHYIEVLSVQCCPDSIKKHCTGFFLIQTCLQPLRQHCIKFWPVQCCPKGIKTTFHRIFSCAMLSGAFQNLKTLNFSAWIM